jgi:hypothetical protein
MCTNIIHEVGIHDEMLETNVRTEGNMGVVV